MRTKDLQELANIIALAQDISPPMGLTELPVDVYTLSNFPLRLGLDLGLRFTLHVPTCPSRNSWLEVNISNAEPEQIVKIEAALAAKGLHWKFAAKVGYILVFI